MLLPDECLPVLFSYRRCPYAIRARMALHASQQQFRTIEINLREKPPELLAYSPKGTVPVLVLAGHKVLEQSLDIMRWALAQSFPTNWHPLNSSEEIQSNVWIERLDGPFKFHLDRAKYSDRFADEAQQTPQAFQAMHQQLALNMVLEWEKWLEQNQTTNLWADNISFTDIAILPFLRQFRIINPAWFDGLTSIPRVQAWLHAFLESAEFAQVMQKQPN